MIAAITSRSHHSHLLKSSINSFEIPSNTLLISTAGCSQHRKGTERTSFGASRSRGHQLTKKVYGFRNLYKIRKISWISTKISRFKINTCKAIQNQEQTFELVFTKLVQIVKPYKTRSKVKGNHTNTGHSYYLSPSFFYGVTSCTRSVNTIVSTNFA